MVLFPFRKYYKMNRNVLLWCKWTAAACASEISGWTLSRSRCATTDKNMPCRFVTFIFLYYFLSFTFQINSENLHSFLDNHEKQLLFGLNHQHIQSEYVMKWKLFSFFCLGFVFWFVTDIVLSSHFIQKSVKYDT